MKTLTTAACVVLSCCALAQDADYKDPIGLYKEGSWIKMKTSMDGMNMIMKMTFKKVTDEEIIIVNETEFMGKTSSTERKIKLKQKDEDKPKEVGKGEVEIEKKTYKCKILEFSGSNVGMAGISGGLGPSGGQNDKKKVKVWICDELKDKIYNGAVKFETDNATMVCTKLSEKITCGAKELECAIFVFEGEITGLAGQGKGKMKIWQAREYPGFFYFKAEMTFDIQEQERTITIEATEWDIKKK